MTNKCEHCGRWFESPRGRRWCSGACRVSAHRTGKAAKDAAALDLLDRMTAALIVGGDSITIAALQREARRLLGD